MSNAPGIPYNNRFRKSSSADDPPAFVASSRLQSVSEDVDMFGHPLSLSHHSGVFAGRGSSEGGQRAEHSGHFHTMTSFEHPTPVSTAIVPHSRTSSQTEGDVPVPMCPGKPRRLSRQISADAKRQLFAASRPTTSSEGGGQVVTSVDSGCDDVFVEVGEGEWERAPRPLTLPDTSLFRSKSTVEVTLSASSTASMLPNPYNRINHRIHGTIWCCSCFYLLFFCCLPAVHYMEQCDVEYNRNNHKRAKSLGRTASFLFFTGTLIALSFFALIFFLVIFFVAY